MRVRVLHTRSNGLREKIDNEIHMKWHKKIGIFLHSLSLSLSACVCACPRIKLLETQNAQKVTFFSFVFLCETFILFHSIFARCFFFAAIPLTIHALNSCHPDEIPLPFVVEKAVYDRGKKMPTNTRTPTHTKIICLIMINSKIPYKTIQKISYHQHDDIEFGQKVHSGCAGCTSIEIRNATKNEKTTTTNTILICLVSLWMLSRK